MILFFLKETSEKCNPCYVISRKQTDKICKREKENENMNGIKSLHQIDIPNNFTHMIEQARINM